MGGVTINVQVPVLDDSYPSDTGRLARVYIPAGIQHMTGARGAGLRPVTAWLGRLRPRLPSAARPDLAPRAGRHRQPDPADPGAARGLQDDRQDRHPAGQLAKLAGLAGSVDTKNIRSYVFSYPRYGTQILAPDLQVPARTSRRSGRR